VESQHDRPGVGISLSPHRGRVASYLGRFDDGSPKGWSLERTAQGWRLTFPNRQQVEFAADGSGLPWTGELPVDPTTTRLWLNSLRYLPVLAGEQEGPPALVGILRSFLQQLEAAVAGATSARSGSLDHQIALQLRTACDLASLAVTEEERLAAAAETIVDLSGRIVGLDLELVDQLDLLRPNNHGIMLALGILHATAVFDWDSAAAWRARATAFLRSALGEVFADSGVANENSPIYQKFYLDLLSQTVDFFEWSGPSDWPREWFTDLLSRAEKAFRRMLLPDGSVPPIGDGCRSGQQDYRPLPGVLTATAEGLVTCSDGRTFFAAVCGNRGVFHKQLDDTAVYLNVDGKDLFTDAGLLSYSAGDELARSVRSQRGHSGLFFEEFDNLDPGAVISYSKGTRSLDARITVADPEGRPFPGIVMRVGFRGTVVRRVVEWKSATSFVLEDEVSSTTDAHRAVRRFLTHPDAAVDIALPHLTVHHGSSWACLCLGAEEGSVRVYRGHQPDVVDADHPDGLTKGFVALRPYEVRPTTLVELPMQPSAELTVRRQIFVTFGGAEREVHCERCSGEPT
jgi:hypothetical protein